MSNRNPHFNSNNINNGHPSLNGVMAKRKERVAKVSRLIRVLPLERVLSF